MKPTMYIVLAIACIMAIAAIPAAMACQDEDESCEVEIPECRGCYVMTAEASLSAGFWSGNSVSGSSTALKDKVGTTTSVDIDAGRYANLQLEVGSAVSTRPTEIESYSIFSGQGMADINMDTTVVVEGRRHHPCLVNADASLEASVVGVFNGGTLATYGMTPEIGDGRMKEIIVSQMVIGAIQSANGNAVANNNLVPGTVYSGSAISPISASNYAGATFYLNHFHH